jgi:putative transcriptional regulator
VLLVASDTLLDPNFAETVLLLLRYGASGAQGLVVNRPSRVALGAVEGGPEIPEAAALPVYYGGPVEPGTVSFLLHTAAPIESARAVLADVQLAGNAAAIAELLRQPGGAERVRALAGYAGWGPGQLDAEVARGDWLVLRGAARQVFDHEPASLWQRLFSGGSGVEARARGSRVG